MADDIVYWTPDRIKKYNADINMVFGGRSDGKTTAVIGEIVKHNVQTGGRGQYVRQMQEDFMKGRAESLTQCLEFAGGAHDINLIDEWTNHEYNTTKYYKRQWYLGRNWTDNKGLAKLEYRKEPFMYASAISQAGRDKGSTPANVDIVEFDEFIPLNGRHLPNEVELFNQLLSTTVRTSQIKAVYMTANSTTWNSPYFEYFGVDKIIPTMEIGQIIVREAYNKDLKSTLAIERTTPARTKTGERKASDKYFIWGDDANTRMITEGAFAIRDFPACPHHFTADNVYFTYWFLQPNNERLRVRLMVVEDDVFLFVDKVGEKTFLRRASEDDLYYSLEFNGAHNHYTNPCLIYAHPATNYLCDAIRANRVFFESDEVGTDFVYFIDRARACTVLEP